MVQVFWRNDGDVYIQFLIPTSTFIILSTSFTHPNNNKRVRSIRSKFMRPFTVDLLDGLYAQTIYNLPFITITEKEFVMWLGRITIDQVGKVEDIGLLLDVKKKLETRI